MTEEEKKLYNLLKKYSSLTKEEIQKIKAKDINLGVFTK